MRKKFIKNYALVKSRIGSFNNFDAGTPSISDPGAILVNECIENNIDVIPVPGPSSVISAVSVSGFSEKFFFYGFCPIKKNHRK